jgi:hypothetical protein
MTPILKTCLSLMLANQQTALLIPDPVQNLVKSRIQKQWTEHHAEYPLVWDRDECIEKQNYSWTSSDISLMGQNYSITEILDGRTVMFAAARAQRSPDERDEPEMRSSSSRTLWWILGIAGLAVGGAVLARQTGSQSSAPTLPQPSPEPSVAPSRPPVSTGVAF